MNKINTLLCTMCRQKQHNSKLMQLRLIQSTIKRHNVNKDNIYLLHNVFSWQIYDRCKSGLQCDILNRQHKESLRIVNDIEPYLIAISISDDEKLYHDILHLMRGYFPSIYTTMERLHHGCFTTCYKLKERN